MQKTETSKLSYAIENYQKNCSSYTLKLSKSKLSLDENYRDSLLWKDTIYIPIDKCASNSISKALLDRGFISIEKIMDCDKALELLKNWNHFAVVREPSERYVSGLCEFIFRNSHKKPYEYIEKSLKKNKFIFDGHTMPMECTLQFRNNVTLFRLDGDLEYKLSKHLKIDQLSIKRLNIGLDHFKESAQKLFDRYCKDNPEFHEFCKKDFDIWESAC
jgi:hypothetical protein